MGEACGPPLFCFPQDQLAETIERLGVSEAATDCRQALWLWRGLSYRIRAPTYGRRFAQARASRWYCKGLTCVKAADRVSPPARGGELPKGAEVELLAARFSGYTVGKVKAVDDSYEQAKGCAVEAWLEGWRGYAHWAQRLCAFVQEEFSPLWRGAAR